MLDKKTLQRGVSLPDHEMLFAFDDLAEKDSVKPFFVGIGGGTASGKTSVCAELGERLGGKVAVISQDSFYKSLANSTDAANYNFDHPDAFDWKEMKLALQKLKDGKSALIPEYDYVKHQRVEGSVVVPTNVIIFEGIMTFWNADIRDMLDMKVFVDCDSDTRLSRRSKSSFRGLN